MNRYRNTRQALSQTTNQSNKYQAQNTLSDTSQNINPININTAQDIPAIVRPSQDRGPEPQVFNITQATMQNSFYRSTFWTGKHLQLTLMSIPPGGEIGLESHPNLDQFIRIESGRGLVMMGRDRDRLDLRRPAGPNIAIIIPAGTWHNLVNTGRTPLKLYSIYAPPQHRRGTVHRTREEAEAEEHG